MRNEREKQGKKRKKSRRSSDHRVEGMIKLAIAEEDRLATIKIQDDR